MQLEPALVRFVNREREWIVRRLGRTSHLCSQKLRPWLERRCVQRISGRTNLQNHRIEVKLHCLVQDQGELGLLLPGIQPGL